MKDINLAEKRNAIKYGGTTPKQFGNLHERMQFLISLAKKHGEKSMPPGVLTAIYDLETEVKYYKPVTPPFGSCSGYKSPELR